MSAVDDVERAVSKLDPQELAEFRAWFDAFEGSVFDDRIEADAQSGKLDGVAEQAAEDFRNGRAREL